LVIKKVAIDTCMYGIKTIVKSNKQIIGQILSHDLYLILGE